MAVICCAARRRPSPSARSFAQWKGLSRRCRAQARPRFVDGALDRNWRQTIAHEIQDSACFGVSLLTGPMILDAIEVSRTVKRLRPGLPVVFGGWHPTLESAQTLREEFVDVVVRHQGEVTLVELLLRLEAGKEP